MVYECSKCGYIFKHPKEVMHHFGSGHTVPFETCPSCRSRKIIVKKNE